MNFAIADDRTRIPVYGKVMQPGDLIPPWERRSEGRFRRTGNLGDNLGGNAAGLPPGPSTAKARFRPRRFLGRSSRPPRQFRRGRPSFLETSMETPGSLPILV